MRANLFQRFEILVECSNLRVGSFGFQSTMSIAFQSYFFAVSIWVLLLTFDFAPLSSGSAVSLAFTVVQVLIVVLQYVCSIDNLTPHFIGIWTIDWVVRFQFF